MVFPLLAGIAAAAAIGGLALQAVGTAATVKGQKEASEASKRAEALREKQLNLESARQRRQAIRNVVRARSLALLGATSQGAQFGSGLSGGLGQITGQGARNVQGVNQAQEIGGGIFKENRNIADAQSLAAFGGGLSSLGSALFSSAPTLGRIG